jgi:ArsR family transcriptional regulator
MKSLSRIFKALGDPTRLRLVNLLAQRGPGICVCDLVEVLQLPQSTISRQIAPLRSLDLIHARRAGTWMLYGLKQDDAAFFQGLRSCLDAAAAASRELQADLARFDHLRDRRKLASCCRPGLQMSPIEGEAACCSQKTSPEEAALSNVSVKP